MHKKAKCILMPRSLCNAFQVEIANMGQVNSTLQASVWLNINGR